MYQIFSNISACLNLSAIFLLAALADPYLALILVAGLVLVKSRR